MSASTGVTLGVDEDARRRFEAARKDGTPAPIEAYLPPESDPRFLPTLEELVHIDLEWAWQSPPAGEPPARVEDYLDRFPQLRDPAIAARLACREYQVRHRHGDRPPPDEFQRRFPGLTLAAPTGRTVVGPPRTVVAPPRPMTGAGPPAVPGYTVLEQIGRGGMGLVYLARQEGLNRVVALKVIRGWDVDEPERARFRTEAETAAGLNHPNIVQVYEVGEAGGVPFLALEYVPGGTLERALGGTPQPPRLAAETVERLALALQAAHAAGVLHRDLKPANVLLAPPPTGHPTGGSLPWVPKVADFGLAKRLGEPGGWTQTGAVLGTPSYMAPEQAAGLKEIGPAADVYGLGAILYDMLTGRPPFRAANPFDTVAQVLGEEPLPPSRLVPKLPRDVETICLKCLEKDPARRYATAAELAADLGRYLRHEPISARRTGPVERAVRWARRRPTAAGLLAAVLVAGVATCVGGVALYFNSELKAALGDAEAKRTEADEQRALANIRKTAAEASAREAVAQQAEADWQRGRAELYRYYAHVNLARQAWDEGDAPRMLDLLDRHVPAAGQPDRRNVEWYYVRRLSRNLHALRGHTHDANWVSFHPDGRRVATAGFDNTVRVWDAVAGTHLLTLDRPPDLAAHWVFATEFHPAGDRLAVSVGPVVSLTDLATRAEVRFAGHTQGVTGIAFDRDGGRMATASLDGTAIVWDVATAKQLLVIRGEPGEQIASALFDPRADRLVWTSRFVRPNQPPGGAVKGWDLRTRTELFRRTWDDHAPSRAAFHPDGAQVAVGSRDGSIRVLNWPDGTDRFQVTAHEKGVSTVRYSPDGRHLASAGYDRVVRVRDATDGREQLVLRGHDDRPSRDKVLMEAGVNGLAYSPDGTRLASVGDDRALMVWDVMPAPSLPPAPPKPPTGVSSPDGTRIAVWEKPVIRVRDTATGAALRDLALAADQAREFWFSPGGDRLAAEFGKPDRTQVQVWDVATGRSLLVARVDPAAKVDVSTDGRWLLARTRDADLWDLESGTHVSIPAVSDFPIRDVVISPDRRLAVVLCDPAAVGKAEWAPRFAEVRVWDLETRQPVAVLRGHTWVVYGAAWSPDGRTLATTSQDATVRLWDPRTGRLLHSLRGHVGTVYDAAFSPDGSRLASCGQDRTVRLWDPNVGEAVLTLAPAPEYVWSVRFDPVSGFIVGKSGPSGARRVWDARDTGR